MSNDDDTSRPERNELLRRHLYERFGTASVGVSADGSSVHVMTPVEAGLAVGGLAIVDSAPGADAIVVQIRRLGLVEREGPELQVAPDLDVDGSISSVAVRPLLRSVAGSGAVLGTINEDVFVRSDTVVPFGERSIRPACTAEISTIIDGLTPGEGSLEIGSHPTAVDVPVRLVAKGFSRHTFMCGQSGSGKTYTTGALFERLLAETTLPIVILDPNSDHVHLGRLRDPEDRSENAVRFGAVAPSVLVARARGTDSTIMLCADFSDLALDWQALLLRLHPVHDAVEFEALVRLTATFTAPYSIHDVLAVADRWAEHDPTTSAVARRIRNLGITEWDVWRREGETSIADVGLRDHRCVVFDLGSLSRPDERTTVALALLGNRWRHRAERHPTLIAVDEAHNLLPASTDNPLVQATTDLGSLIAGEGRKYGLHLFVATQRPSKVHPNVVSQCDNLVLMRMNGSSDIDDLVELFSHVPESMVRASSGFGLGRALFAGPISPVPMFTQVGTRVSPEGGGDVSTSWASRPVDGVS